MRARWILPSPLFAVPLIALLLAAHACARAQQPATGTGGSGGGDMGTGGACGAQCTTGTATGTGGGGGLAIMGLQVLPADPVVTVTNGVVTPLSLQVELNGNDVTNKVTFSYARPDIGTISKAGVFTPTGNLGGAATLTVTYETDKTTTSIGVALKNSADYAGLTPAQEAAFDTPTGGPDPAVTVVYPYDATVFPLGIIAPEIQWNGGGSSDLYRVQISEKYFEYTELFTAPTPPQSFTLADEVWTQLGLSGGGSESDPVHVALTRMSGTTIYQPSTETWHIAQGRLYGSVYYWQLPDQCGTTNGTILRIKPGAQTTDTVYTSSTCYGCHSVSRDGTKMMASFNLLGGFQQLEIDLGVSPATLGNSLGLQGTMSAFNEKGDKILVSNDNDTDATQALLRIVQEGTGVVLNPNALGTGCGEPAWSPDGTKIAGVCGLGGVAPPSYVFDQTKGSLTTGDVGADGVTISNIQVIVPQGANPDRPANPSFGPGSQYIAFSRGNDGGRSDGTGSLWLTDLDGTTVKQLNVATGNNLSFDPVFAPLRAGGYSWIAFVSRRDYGNHLVGAGRQQIWVTAIDDPPGAADPSHPAFWLSGQEICGKNENAYFALDPCLPGGRPCTTGVECCNGQCVLDPTSQTFSCGQQGACSEDGNGCLKDTDCCDTAAVCTDGFCTPPIEK